MQGLLIVVSQREAGGIIELPFASPAGPLHLVALVAVSGEM